GVCSHCPRLIDGISNNLPRKTVHCAVHLVHPDNSAEMQPYFVYPLRRLLGHFEAAQRMRFCSPDVRKASSDPSARCAFESPLFLHFEASEHPDEPALGCGASSSTSSQVASTPLEPFKFSKELSRINLSLAPEVNNLQRALKMLLNNAVSSTFCKDLLSAVEYLLDQRSETTVEELAECFKLIPGCAALSRELLALRDYSPARTPAVHNLVVTTDRVSGEVSMSQPMTAASLTRILRPLSEQDLLDTLHLCKISLSPPFRLPVVADAILGKPVSPYALFDALDALGHETAALLVKTAFAPEH
ncbi:MAG: hypothetical protein Q8M03_14280, partial [Legionella sp.]|nr:hypothetical protein [Legionella sp.]